ncbi:MAG: oxygen-independent coproporphyrinogen III oxidase [Pseudomonadota bacterium]
MTTATVLAEPAVPPELLRRLDVPGPRYTSYPTADRFVEAFGPEDYRRALQGRISGPGSAAARPLSLYIHIPFCESVCYYCACNKVVTRHHEKATEYLLALDQEIALHVDELGARQPVSQLHLGGGSPTFLSDAELARVVETLRYAFRVLPNAEISIEIDPRTVDPERLARLAAMGFNRLSLGVQDFDADVQRAVHREQSHENVARLLDAARKLGFRSTNMDLIYGLPKQTVAGFANTLAQVRALRPDRIALYAYAHLPQRFKPQRRIHAVDLPPPEQKIAMLAQAINAFADAGYDHIGMDHFALPDDALAIARRQGRLHRNFQGYSTCADGDLIGLGVSAISRVGGNYSQNAKTLDEYYDAVRRRQFAVVRGLAPARDDLVRRAIIMGLMCQGRVEFESISDAYLLDVRQVFAAELEALEPMQASGLVVLEPDAIGVTPLGWYFVRSIAMVFDRYLQADRARAHFSRVI